MVDLLKGKRVQDMKKIKYWISFIKYKVAMCKHVYCTDCDVYIDNGGCCNGSVDGRQENCCEV